MRKIGDVSAAVRIRVMKRDRFTCTYCGALGQDAELEIDHIIPVAKGGSHHMSNLTTACVNCNQKKGAGELPMTATSRADIKIGGHGLVGLYLHTIVDGLIEYQGRVVAVDNDTALVQLFSALDGRPTSVVPMLISEVYRCRLYCDGDDWRAALDRQWCKIFKAA